MSKHFKTFHNTFVYVLTKSLRSTVNKNTGSVVIEGFLHDECDEYYYFTQHPDSKDIIDSVRKAEVVRMFIPMDEMMAMIDSQDVVPDGELN